MLSSLSIKWTAAALFLGVLYIGHTVDKNQAVKTATALMQGHHAALALAASEANRQREQELTLAAEKVRYDYAKQKTLNAALVRTNAERLREYEVASTALGAASSDTRPTPGVDAPYRLVASECARSLVALDDHAAGLRATVGALQSFAATVRLK